MVLFAQQGTSGEDHLRNVAIAQDGSIVVAGSSYDRESEESGFNFAAVKLDSNGNVQWTWQVRWKANRFSFPYHPLLLLLVAILGVCN